MKIEFAQFPITNLINLARSNHAARLYKDDLGISHIGVKGQGDFVAEIVDMLSRLMGINWDICIGVHKDGGIFSVRTSSPKIASRSTVLQIIGNPGIAGGRGTIAGGQFRPNHQDSSQMANQITKMAIQRIKGDVCLVGLPLE